MPTLEDQYLKELDNIKTINVCIVGQDPYPKGANGIAFCKNEFKEFFDPFCCGKDVLESLGYDEGWIRSNYDNPIELFLRLLGEGIAFINVSRVPIGKATVSSFIEDQSYNNAFLEKSKNIILLGMSYTEPHFDQYYSGFTKTETVCHPSNNVKNNYPITWAKIYDTTYLAKYK